MQATELNSCWEFFFVLEDKGFNERNSRHLTGSWRPIGAKKISTYGVPKQNFKHLRLIVAEKKKWDRMVCFGHTEEQTDRQLDTQG